MSADNINARDEWYKKALKLKRWVENKRKWELAQSLRVLHDGEATAEQKAAAQAAAVRWMAIMVLDGDLTKGPIGLFGF